MLGYSMRVAEKWKLHGGLGMLGALQRNLALSKGSTRVPRRAEDPICALRSSLWLPRGGGLDEGREMNKKGPQG